MCITGITFNFVIKMTSFFSSFDIERMFRENDLKERMNPVRFFFTFIFVSRQ